MKIFYAIALTIILVSLPVHSSVIRARNGVINCDGLICPDGSVSCIVSQKTFGDLTKYKIVRICADDNGNYITTLGMGKELAIWYGDGVLLLIEIRNINFLPWFSVPTDTATEEFDNPHPGQMIDNISQYGGGRKLTEAEKKELQEQLDKITEETGKIVSQAADYARETTNYWNNWTSDFNAKMAKQFPPGFPFNK